jgi:colanic acid biosynthesis glycosyl transferase WcaI
VLLLLVGNGALKPALEQQAKQLRLGNVRFLDYQAKGELAESLSAADLHLVPLHPRLARCLMPSKLYGILASGTAILAPAPAESELGQTVRDQGVGLVVAPEDSHALAEAIRWCADHRAEVRHMGDSARTLAVAAYDRPRVTARFAELLTRVCRDDDRG